jgi:phage shock protein PspC (stress-responsive transcriptional regulator)
MNKVKYFVEWQVFGVCSAIGQKFGIATSTIRKYFIYLSCITFGWSFLVYLVVAFWLNIKRYLFTDKRNPINL